MKRLTLLLLILFSVGLVLSSCTVPSEGTDTSGVGTGPKTEVYNIVISEVMPDNEKLCLGHDLDWIELHNLEEVPLSLDGYYLTDVPNVPNKMSLAGKTVSAEGYLLIVLDEDAPFHLSSKGETVYLTCNGEVISQITYPAGKGGETYSMGGICTYPTPGYANTLDGYISYLNSVPLPDLIISEVVSSNGSILPFKGQYYDLAEICNVSSAPINLKDYTFTDKRSEPARYTFPDVTLAPGECYVVYCSGNASLGANHASFKVSSSGESLYLAKDGKITDALTVPADLNRDESYGRSGKLTVYFPKPTLGSANEEGYITGLAAPKADVASGIYSAPVSVTLTGPGTIFYTLDGSCPTAESEVYRGPITVRENTTIRTFCTDGARNSTMTAYTYLFGTEHDLPIVSLAIPQDRLTGEQGILNHIDVTYEYEGIVTLIENGEEKFSVPVGFRLHGNESRQMPKQNFQLRFRSEYGASKLQYPVFEDRTITEYDSLLLKGGSEDWNSSVMRDELCTGLVDGTTALAAQAIKPVVLYLDGEYWGIYYLRERFNDDYVASHYDVSEESVDILYSSGAYVQDGSDKTFKEIRNYVKDHDMSKAEHYDWLCERIDVVSLMDWYICRSYFGDKDTANIRRFRSVEGDGKWRWMFFDLDWAFYHTTDAPLTSISTSGGDNLLFRAAVASVEGRDTFLKRYSYLMNTILNEQSVITAIDGLVSVIESEMARDRERWGKSLSGWESAVERLRNYVRDGKRTNRVLADLADYFDLTEVEMEMYFGNLSQTE